MKKILDELLRNENIRTNLSSLRQQIKDEDKKQILIQDLEGHWKEIVAFLSNEDPKTRKNAALLLGDLQYQEAEDTLYEAYLREDKLFVKASYLQALGQLDAEDRLPELKQRLEELLSLRPDTDSKKHVEEQIRALRKILIRYDGINHHTPELKGKKVSVILLTNRTHRETVRRMIPEKNAKVHPLGVLVETDDLEKLMKLRTYRDMVFPIQSNGYIPADPIAAAKQLWDSDLMEVLNSLHKEQGSYYFRIECKSAMELAERSTFTRRLAGELESLSNGMLVNSTGDYEVEIRLIANKEGSFFPCLRIFTIENPRFTYRKNAIAASIHPSTAALIMELAKEYLKEDAQILDPFCGVGTMLIERNQKVPAREMYGTDTFGDAIVYARENTQLAGVRVNYIHRDFFDFKHEYLFQEIITNMPVRGKKTRQEMDEFYRRFFEKAKTLLTKDAVLILYTNEIGFVKKQLRLQKEYTLLQETVMQPKTDFYLLIIGYKG